MTVPHRTVSRHTGTRTGDIVTPLARSRTAVRMGVPRRRRVGVTVLLLALALCLAGGRVAAQAPTTPARVTVRPGETLSEIALRYYGTAGAAPTIAAANGLASPDRILAGTDLALPASRTGGVVAGGAATTARRITVAPGETLSEIALRTYGSDAYTAPLAAANGITNPDRLFAGLEIVLPTTLTPLPSAGSGASPARSISNPLAGRRVCLDPGHGGAPDPGATFTFENGRVLREADVTLEIALSLAGRLRAQGLTVLLTRQTDVPMELGDRAAICNAVGAELTVSIHLNGVDERSVNGALALWAKPKERALAELMAGFLQDGLFGARTPGITAFGARHFPGRVLLYTAMPAVLVEPTFLTNPTEARALLTPTSDITSRRAQIAREIERGIVSYLR